MMKRVAFDIPEATKKELEELVEWGSLSAFYREVTDEFIRLLKKTGNTSLARLYFTETGRRHLKLEAQYEDRGEFPPLDKEPNGD